MKKWLILGGIVLIVALILSGRQRNRRGLLATLNRYFTLLAWFMLVVYGLAFLYWILRGLT